VGSKWVQKSSWQLTQPSIRTSVPTQLSEVSHAICLNLTHDMPVLCANSYVYDHSEA